MKKILWLPSWYPSKIDRFTGDFIQRHARSLALFQPLVVIYVVKDEHGLVTNDVLAETTTQQNLQETVIYYHPASTPIAFANKLLSSRKYMAVYKKYLQQYIEKEGLPDFVHVHVPIKAGLVALWLKRKYKLPFFVTEHWGAYHTFISDNYFTRGIFFRRLTKKIFEAADLVHAVSESSKKQLHELFYITKFVVINNVADEQLFYYSAPSPVHPFIFIHVSSFGYEKNIEGILTAFGRLKQHTDNWRFLVVGPYNQRLINMTADLNITGLVEWKGILSYEEVATVTRAAHCMVMFSRSENSPCTIIEALMAGLPVISSNVGGIPELVNEDNGRLVSPGDVEALKEAMAVMIEKYGRYDRSEIATQALARFSYKVIGAQIAGLYKIKTHIEQFTV